MDSKLRSLERGARVSGDFAAYDAELARIGRKRITLTRKTLILFSTSESPFEGGPNDLDKPRIHVTPWSSHDFYSETSNHRKVDDVFRCGEYECGRVLEIERRDLIVRLEQLVPITAEQLNAQKL